MSDAAEPLSHTELEILQEVSTGATNREIAHKRTISEATVKKHLSNINQKLGTSNRTEAVRFALEQGIISVDTPSGDGASAEAARRLAAELERTRHRARRTVILIGLTAATAIVAVLVWALLAQPDDTPPGPGPTPRPPAVRRWQTRASLPAPRSYLALVDDPTGLHAIAGLGDDGPLADNLRYDNEALAWERLAPKPVAVSHVDAALLGGRILVPGGCDASGAAIDLVETYAPTDNAWSRHAATLPEPTCEYALANREGKLYLFGGRSGADDSTASSAVWRLDPDDDAWVREPDMPVPRVGAAVAVLTTGIHLIGGRDRNGEATRDHWIFRPDPSERERWLTASAPALPEARSNMAAIPALGGLFVVGGGGLDGGDPLGVVFWSSEARRGWVSDPPQLPIPEGAPGMRTPQRGMGVVLEGEPTRFNVVVAGGEAADGTLLDGHLAFPLIESILIPGGG